MRCSRPALIFLVIIPATCCSRPAKVVSVANGDAIIVLHKDQQQPDSASISSSSS